MSGNYYTFFHAAKELCIGKKTELKYKFVEKGKIKKLGGVTLFPLIS